MEEKNQKISRKRKRKLRKIWKHTLSALSCLVVFCTTYALILPAITAETKTYCDKEEHTHTENCYRSDDLLCDLEESDGVEAHSHNDTCYEVKKELICSEAENEEHTHNEDCYKDEKTLICTKEETKGEKGHEHSINCYRSDKPLCEKEEHTHDRMCYSNQDLKEKEEDWKKSLPKNLDNLETLNEKLAAIAYSQKGYEEVKENYIEDEETNELKYYTRYGEWYGKPYEDWNIMFTSFVLRYAGINQTEIPWGQDWDEWVKLLSKKELVVDNTYEPINGDIVLLKDKEDKNNPDKEINAYSGFIYGKEEEKDKITYKAIIGDFEDKVEEVLLKDKDYEILGYIHPKDESKKDEENKEDETDKDDSDKEENPDEEDKENKPSEDDLLKPEEPEESEKIEYQLPEYFLYENEDFTLKLTPIINGKDTMGGELIENDSVNKDLDSENVLKEDTNTSQQDESSLINEENIQKRIDEEYSLTEADLKKISEDNKNRQEKDKTLSVPVLSVTEIEDETDDSILKLKEDNVELLNNKELIDLSFYRLRFLVDDIEVNLQSQAFEAELTPTDSFVEKYGNGEELADAAPDAEVGAIVSVLNNKLGVDDNLSLSKESESIIVNDNYDYSSLSFVTYADDPIGITIHTTPNPEFKVEIYGKLYKNKEATYEDLNKELTERQSSTFQVIDMTKIPQEFAQGSVQYKDYKKGSDGKFVLELSDKEEEIYSPTNYKFHQAPSLEYFNKLNGIDSYILKQIWVKPNENSEWSKFDYDTENPLNNIRFTNSNIHPNIFNPANPNDFREKYYLVTEGTIIRLIFEETTSNKSEDTTFWDYTFFDNSSKKVYDADGKRYGINNQSNYSNQSTPTLLLGNAYISEEFYKNDTSVNKNKNGNPINQTAGTLPITTTHTVKKENGDSAQITVNRQARSYPVFGLVENYLDSNGNLQYKVNAPNLFDDGDAIGKTSDLEGSLKFHRTGDTYRLYGVNGPNGYVNDSLDTFTTRGNWNNTAMFHYNGFFPLDEVNTDTKYGRFIGKTSDGKNVYNTPQLLKMNGSKLGSKGTYDSDDAQDHNYLFGMKYQVKFDLDENYTGPLKYFFFGDDDLWVFLDGKLICDIGGVHQSIGAEVDIRKAFENKLDPGEHVLTVYYLERGQSGSSCYMEYTLPNVVSMTPANSTGSLRLEKQSNDKDPEKDYEFEILLQDGNGNELANEYALTVYTKSNDPNQEDIIDQNRSNVTYRSRGKILLKNNQYAIIKYLPIGTKYTITENLGDKEKEFTSVAHCTSSVNACVINSEAQKTENGKYVIEGWINSESISHYVKVFNNKSFTLPETGGVGIDPSLIASGAGIMTTAIFSIGVNKKGRCKKRKRKIKKN